MSEEVKVEAPVESAPAAEQPKADLMSKTIHKDSDPVVSVRNSLPSVPIMVTKHVAGILT